MTQDTADRLKEHISLIREGKLWDVLGKIPTGEVAEVIKIFVELGSNPLENDIKTAKHLFDELWWLPDGLMFVTTEEVSFPLNSGHWGDEFGDLLGRIYHSPLGHSIRHIEEILAKWDELDSYQELTTYWIKEINNALYEYDNWSLELDNTVSNQVMLKIAKGTSVSTFYEDTTGDIMLDIGGLYIIYGDSGLATIKIKFDEVLL
jgi:hypothetical protein